MAAFVPLISIRTFSDSSITIWGLPSPLTRCSPTSFVPQKLGAYAPRSMDSRGGGERAFLVVDSQCDVGYKGEQI